MTAPKIVYVLSTDRPDYLYLLAANALISRVAVPGCSTVCVIDPGTHTLAAASGVRLQDWVEEVVVVETPHREPLLNSRFLKTTLRSHVAGDFLFLDLDAVIVSPELLAHLEAPCLAASQNFDHANLTDKFPEDIGRTIYEAMGWAYPFLPYVNSGVLFCRDNAQCHALFQRWHRLWTEQRERTGSHLDQPALNRALWESPECLTLTPPNLNSPVDVGPRFVTNAWVYHYHISVYSGKPKANSLLGIVRDAIHRRGEMDPAMLRWALAQKQAFLPFWSMRWFLSRAAGLG